MIELTEEQIQAICDRANEIIHETCIVENAVKTSYVVPILTAYFEGTNDLS